MNRDQQISDIFLAACDLPAQDRGRYLEEACGSDTDLLSEVESLLEHDGPDTLISDVLSDVLSDVDRDSQCLAVPDIELPGYEIFEEIGRGGLGVVFKARQIALNRIVAVKMLLPRLFPRPRDLERLLLEANAVARLQHPNVVQVFDEIEAEGNHCLCMEYVPGGNLADRLDGRPQPPETAARLVEILARAMQSVHEAGYLHRDLKPANILLAATENEHCVHLIAEDGTSASVQPKITDFGLVRQLGEDSGLTDAGAAVGTPSYMPPEQARSETTVTQSVDVYSLGAILYETLVGRPPFRGASVLETLSQVYHQEPVPPRKLVPNVPADLEAVCLKCLEKEPTRRYPSAAALADDLRRVQAGRPTIARPITGMGQAWRWCRRNQIAVMLLFIAAMTGFVIQRTMTERENATRAAGLVNSLLNAEITRVPEIVSDLSELRTWGDPLLQREIARVSEGSTERLRLALGLLPVDETQIGYLARQLPVCGLGEFGIIRDALLPHQDEITAELWELAQDEQQEPNTRFQAAAALVQYSGEDERWGGVDSFVAEHFTTSISTADFGQWLAVFRPARRHLTSDLIEIHADRSHSPRQLEGAAVLLADYLRDEPNKLIEVLLVADNMDEYSPLISAMRPNAATVLQPLFDVVSSTRVVSSASKHRSNTQLNRQAIAAAALLQLGYAENVWPMLNFRPTPTRRSMLIQYLGRLNADHNARASRMKTEQDDSIRQAIIESFGVQNPASVPPAIRSEVVEQLKGFYQNDPDPGVHASAAWTLRQWGVALPELSSGGPTLTAQQLARISELNSGIHAEEESRLLAQPADLPASLADGLVVYYPFDETEGTESPSAIEGKPTAVYEGPGQPKWIPGVVGGAVWLEGNPSKEVQGGYFNCGNAFDPERTDAFSAGCWFFLYPRFETQFFFGKGSGFKTRFRGDTFRTSLLNSYEEHNYIERIAGSIDRLSGCWNHILVVNDGSSKAAGVKFYIDGQPAASFANVDELTRTIRNTSPFAIGGFTDEWSFKGGVDDFRIYDRVLSGEEVRALYVSGRRTLARVDAKERTPEQQAVLIPAKRRAADKSIADSQPRGATTSSLRAQWTNEWKRIRRWYVNGQGQTMLVVPNPSFIDNPRIDHSYAIASHEVTIDQFQRFRPDHPINPKIASSGDCPVHSVSWLAAVEYCNWLSEQEGIPREQWVYEPDQDGNFSNDTIVRGNFLDLQGYRLPTGEEWAYAGRAGTISTYAFGESESLVGNYGWTNLNSAARSHPVGSLLPNRWGLFDMLGNVQEWHQESLAGPGTGFKLGGGSFSKFPWDKDLNKFGLSNASRARASSTLYLGFRPVRSLPALDHH